jgi:hypothetical protein
MAATGASRTVQNIMHQIHTSCTMNIHRAPNTTVVHYALTSSDTHMRHPAYTYVMQYTKSNLRHVRTVQFLAPNYARVASCRILERAFCHVRHAMRFAPLVLVIQWPVQRRTWLYVQRTA